jgi:formylglycine-generating enzyme required for sulfatase activity
MDLCAYGNGADQKAHDSIKGRVAEFAPCNDGYAYTSPGGHYAPNAFGLYDMAGNAWQWTADCWRDGYVDAPTDGAAWTAGSCESVYVLRGGAWVNGPGDLRAARRVPSLSADEAIGFRVARTLTAP